MSNTQNEHYGELDKKYYLPVFKRFPVTIEKGKGCFVWDVDGKKYLDALAGIAVNTLGHCHPAILKAISDQASEIIHVSNFFTSKPQVELAEKLAKLSDLERVYFTNSGAESLEGAFKIARKHAFKNGRGGKIISFENSFHGRTLATIATGKKDYQKGFGPMPDGFVQVPFNDIEAVKDAADKETAAIVIEPIQGEGGINVAGKKFLEELRAFCDTQGISLIFDEVQCGMGRTGHWFAKDLFGVKPDIMTLAKGLGSGVPIGAILSSEEVSQSMDYGDHGTTFGGNPLVCAAAIATIRVIEDEQLLERVQKNGEWLLNELRSVEEPAINEVRGTGLMIGVEMDLDVKQLVNDMLENGVIANATAGNVLRLVPPLIITKEEMEIIVNTFKESIANVTANA